MQGGLQSLQEAVHYSVPVVAIPFFGDQLFNARKILDAGIGVTLDIDAMTEDSIVQTLMEVIENKTWARQGFNGAARRLKNLSRVRFVISIAILRTLAYLYIERFVRTEWLIRSLLSFFFNTDFNGAIILNWLILTKTGAIQLSNTACKYLRIPRSYYPQVSEQHKDNVGDCAGRVGKTHGESCMERGACIEISKFEAFTLPRTWYVTDRLLCGVSVPSMSRCFIVFHSSVIKISVLSWEASR